MKIYSKQLSEGTRELVGYQCDECGSIEHGTTVPREWLVFMLEVVPDEYYCPECITSCIYCKRKFSSLYARYWFKNGFCETCQGE